MTSPPAYVVHEVNEKDVTVDWFFARGRGRRRIVQLALMITGWFFAILPVVITVDSLAYHDDPRKGWWHYREGFRMWEVTSLTLAFLVAVFIVGYMILYLVNRAAARAPGDRETYDAGRLERRLELAAAMYENKYGDEALRLDRKHIVIERFQDLETYELRDWYHEFGVG